MTNRNAVLPLAVFIIVCVGAVGATWWLIAHGRRDSVKAVPPAPPASITRTLKEGDINVITLSPEAVVQLALRTAVVEQKSVRRSRVYGGEVTIPAGQVILVSAPLGGVLKAPAGGVPRPGLTLEKGQPVFQLLPLLSPEGRVTLAATKIDADGQVNTAKTQFDAMQIALDRAKRVFQSDAGSRRAVDEAQAQSDLARKALEAAMARRDVLRKVVGEVEKGTAAPLSIESPASGLLRNVSALPDQSVPLGAALFEVLNLDRVWVRVPVYVGDLRDVDTTSDSQITELTVRPGDPARSAKPVTAPPSANAAAGTVDLFYELDNRTVRYSPGQRIGATLTLKGDAESLTVPWSSVIHDIHGGTWVYEQIGDRSFSRRRVAVRYVTGDTAVLAAGPAPGTKVVAAAAAELFGTETGFSK